MDNLYTRIMNLCESKQISGYRLCKDTGIQPSILTDLKMGRQCGLSAKNASKIAAYFNVSVDYLINGIEKVTLSDESKDFEKQLAGIDFALWGKVKHLSDAQKRDIMKFAEFIESKNDEKG